MATYFHGTPEIQSDGLQTLYLMNPGYVGYSEPAGAPASTSMVFINSGISSLNPMNLSHSPPQQQQHFVGIPLQPLPENSMGRFHYNLWNQPSASNSVGSDAQQQGLSLSLSPQQLLPPFGYRPEADVAAPVLEMTAAAGDAAGLQSMLVNSMYLKAAQELLDEVVSVGKGVGKESSKKDGENSPVKGGRDMDAKGEGETSGKREVELTTAERQELQMKKAKLVSMFDEVEQRYRQYHHQMQIVVSSFEAVAGHCSARTYTALALQTISKQFRCLRDAITGQIKATNRSLGEEDCTVVGGAKSIGSRLRLVDHHLRQQRALQQLGMMQQNAWRPQRGLPERAVSILRAWLFEHFLHPYPKDSDKIMLAKQTGLTRSQVSNWFINARVRLWKPMVEDMYVEEMKDHEKHNPGEKSSNTDANEDSISKASNQTQTEHAATLTSKLDRASHPKPPSSIATSAPKFGITQAQEVQSIMPPPEKRARNNESLHLSTMHHSISLEMKPEEISNRELLMKFMEARSNRNNGGGFSAYSIGEIGRFDPHEQSAPSFQGNCVSLTLGLPHCETLSLSGAEPSYLSNESIPIGNEANAFCSLNNNPQPSHPSNPYEGIEIQNRKRFAAQLLPDFVA